MHLLLRLSKKQKIIAGVTSVILLVAGLSLVLATRQDQSQNNVITTAQQKLRAKNDDLKKDRLHAILNAVNYTYTANDEPFPPATEKGWATVLDTVSLTDSFYDPYTQTIFQFTEDDPDFGELQYGPGMACAKNQTLVSGFGDESLAFRAKVSDGFICLTTFQGEAPRS